jgi:hypothetical protein
MSEKLNLFSSDDHPNDEQAKTASQHVEEAKYQLSDEAKQKRANQRKLDEQRVAERAEKRRLEIERAAEQGIDIRTAEEIFQDKRKQRSEDIEALREQLRNNTP